MTGQETEAMLLQITSAKKADMQKKVKTLDNTQKTAKKAYSTLIGLIEQMEKMVTMKFSNEPYDEKYYSVREQRVFGTPDISYFPDKREWYEAQTDTDSRESFIVYAHAIHMVRCCFYDKRLEELKKSEESGDIEKMFENSIVVDALKELLDDWKSSFDSVN